MAKKNYSNAFDDIDTQHDKTISLAKPNEIIPQSNFDYSDIEDWNEVNNLILCERMINTAKLRIAGNYKEICENLYQAQQIFSKVGREGRFSEWFGSLGMEKNGVYRLLQRYNLYLKNPEPLLLTDEVSIRTISTLNSVEDIEIVDDVIEKIKTNELKNSKEVDEYIGINKENVKSKNIIEYKENGLSVTLKNNKNISLSFQKENFSEDEFIEFVNFIEIYLKGYLKPQS